MDHWSKCHTIFPLMYKAAAEVVLGLHNVFSYPGMPKILHFDNGREFVNEIIPNLISNWPRELLSLMGGPGTHNVRYYVYITHYSLTLSFTWKA